MRRSARPAVKYLIVAMWLLLAPGEDWTWTIVGGYDSRDDCEGARRERMDAPLLCSIPHHGRELEASPMRSTIPELGVGDRPDSDRPL